VRRRLFAGAAAALLAGLFALTLSCASKREGSLQFWGLGREGEVVASLVPEFERRYPGVRLKVEQIPWTSAHEKLLTAVVGKSPPDVAQLGNTWIPEFAAIGSLENLNASLASSRIVSAEGFFSGVWRTNVYEGALYGIPWYVDTRVLFYRADLLARAGYPEFPRGWDSWREAMRRVRAFQPPGAHPILLPTNEWEQLTLLGVSEGATLLDTRGTRGAFRQPPFEAAARFYVGLFHEGLAPIVSYSQLGNAYQEFARGNITMWMTGPWNLGEFRRRLPAEQQSLWMTAPLPSPDPAAWPGITFAGGSSLAVFQTSLRKPEAWKLIEFLSEPEIQSRFYDLSGDLPARKAAWESPALAADAKARAFRVQLERVAPMPRVPEWEQIAQTVAEDLEPAVRGRRKVEEALAKLDSDVDRILEKRRWILSRRPRR